MVTIWGWCLVFVIAGQQPIVQFDYKTEADCDASRIAVKAQLRRDIAVLVRADPQAGKGRKSEAQEAEAGAQRQAAMRIAASLRRVAPLGERLELGQLSPRLRQAFVHCCRGGFPPAGNLPNRFLLDPICALTIGTGVHRTAIEEGAALDGKRLVMNIANDMGLRFQNDVAPLDGALDPSVDDHAAGGDGSGDVSPARNNERGAMQFAVDLAVDLDQALGRDAAYDLQTFGNDGPTTPEQTEHDFPST
jgi:hypothetical protein